MKQVLVIILTRTLLETRGRLNSKLHNEAGKLHKHAPTKHLVNSQIPD